MMYNNNPNLFIRKRNTSTLSKYGRFIVYFIVFFLAFQSIKFIYSSFFNNQESNADLIARQDLQFHLKHAHHFYKPQQILHYTSDNETYLDFPWYKQPHTRPQFRPHANITTTTLTTKQRTILLQKAILQAKQRAQKKFNPTEYQGIRGTRFETAQETKALRDQIDCFTTGQWIKAAEDEEAFRLKHIQDPIYSTCDHQFYKTHPETEKRPEIQYTWQPSSESCALKTKVDSKNWCKLLKGRNTLLVGDLPHYQFHELLLDAFREEPTVCFGELNCKDHTICKARDTRLRYVRNDILSTIRKFQNRDQGHPLANIVEWPFVTSTILSSYPILILSRTAVIGDDDILFTRRLIQALKVIRETSPDALVIYKSSFIGHPFCDDATEPLSKSLTDEQLRNLPFGWSETARRNAIAKTVVEAAGGLYIDFANMMDKRPDGHVGKDDCSRYCIPGPLDATMQVLYHVFLALD